MAKVTGDHVLYTPGAGEDQVIAHVLKNEGDTVLKLQLPDTSIVSVPHRESSHDGEDLGRTWQNV